MTTPHLTLGGVSLRKTPPNKSREKMVPDVAESS